MGWLTFGIGSIAVGLIGIAIFILEGDGEAFIAGVFWFLCGLIIVRRDQVKFSPEVYGAYARAREKALDYDAAIKIWDELGELEEAGRVRKLQFGLNAPGVLPLKIEVQIDSIKGDKTAKTEIEDIE